MYIFSGASLIFIIIIVIIILSVYVSGREASSRKGYLYVYVRCDHHMLTCSSYFFFGNGGLTEFRVGLNAKFLQRPFCGLIFLKYSTP